MIFGNLLHCTKVICQLKKHVLNPHLTPFFLARSGISSFFLVFHVTDVTDVISWSVTLFF